MIYVQLHIYVIYKGSCLDAVCKLLQSFGSYAFHGGDQSGQLVLSASRRPLEPHHQNKQQRFGLLGSPLVVALEINFVNKTVTNKASPAA